MPPPQCSPGRPALAAEALSYAAEMDLVATASAATEVDPVGRPNIGCCGISSRSGRWSSRASNCSNGVVAREIELRTSTPYPQPSLAGASRTWSPQSLEPAYALYAGRVAGQSPTHGLAMGAKHGQERGAPNRPRFGANMPGGAPNQTGVARLGTGEAAHHELTAKCR